MKHKVAATIMSVSLAGGALSGVILSRSAGAETGSTSTTAPAAATAPAPGDRAAERQQKLSDALQGLVDNGTITAAQRDAVVGALKDAKLGDGGRGHGGPGKGGMRGGPGGLIGAGLDAAATALGTDAATLRQALRDGKSIADVAAEKGVAVDTVVKALSDAATVKIDQAVTDGKLTQTQADSMKASLTERITAMVNAKGGMKGPGDHKGRGPRGGADDGGADDGGASSTTTPTTTA